MMTLFSLLENDLPLEALVEAGYAISETENECDILICGLEDTEYAGVLVDPNETFFIVALNDPENEQGLVPGYFNAWIHRRRLDKLPTMLNVLNETVLQKRKLRLAHEALSRFSVDTTVHQGNLEGIKRNMRESTKEIEMIFEDRVEEMRSVHKDASATHEHLTRLKEQIVPEVFQELEASWDMTRSIISRTDEIIKAMFGFITVLQCEDRITQMIDGISNVMQNDTDFCDAIGHAVPLSREPELRARLVDFYTIQEQRDYALGNDDALTGCKPEQADIDEFTLF